MDFLSNDKKSALIAVFGTMVCVLYYGLEEVTAWEYI